MADHDDNREIYRYVVSVFGGNPTVHQFLDDDKRSRIDIVTCEDSPIEGVSSYSTLGLSGHPLFLEGKEFPARTELVGACGARYDSFPQALATAAFCVINSRWFCHPYAVFPDVLAMYGESQTMKHVFFTYPFLWDDRLAPLALAVREVHWLQAIPISDGEYSFAKEFGGEKLNDLFIERQIDIYDIHRSSVAEP